MIVRARELRRQMTLPEGLLWRELRKRPHGLKFRRQHPLGWYVLDFYCAKVRLVVEVDGQSHVMGDKPQQDARRDAWLKARGLRILRYSASDVMNDLPSVVAAIGLACRN